MIALLALGMGACTTNTAGRVVTTGQANRTLQDNFTSLEQAVRTLPGVLVSNGYARYRGALSFEGDVEMKVVANNRIVGGVAAAERQFPLNEIRALRVIRPLDAAQRYGSLASNGAIELLLVENER